MNALLEQARDLSTTLGLPDLKPVALQVSTDMMSDPSSDGTKVFKAIHEFGPQSGWIWDDAHPVQWFTKPGAYDARGRVFKAELSDGGQRSALVRHVDGDTWSFSILTETAGATYLAEDTQQISTLKGDANLSRLRYRRYWQMVPGASSKVIAVRFLGFGPPAGQ